ncbi:MAG TPA: AarF/UbiB family protein, partial [Methylophilaceae bacterium]|nr:AarF/UbiB family protein [Methylophilaceae bacterium]
MHYLRLIYILWVALWFRLDDFITHDSGLHPIQILIKACLFWRVKKESRGVRLRLALEKLGPLFVKFGQVLSTRRDLLPEEVANELSKLQDQVPPIDYAEIEKTITAAFGRPLESIFAQFDTQCIASASVAQVHFARLNSGEDVAVKVLRPNIEKVIEQDLSILRSLAWFVKNISSE